MPEVSSDEGEESLEFMDRTYILAGIFLGCMILAVITVSLLVDSLKRFHTNIVVVCLFLKVDFVFVFLGFRISFLLNIYFRFGEDNKRGSGTGVSGIQLLAITLKLCKEKHQLLLIPMIAWLGVEQAFMGADFTQVRT